MTDGSACPVPTAEELQIRLAIAEAENAMMAAIDAAIARAHAQVEAVCAAAMPGVEAPSAAFFAATAHQKLFLDLCHADRASHGGGDPAIAAAILRNGANIATHHWDMDWEQTRPSARRRSDV